MSVDRDEAPGSAITSIKNGVARSLEHADANVKVHTTDYFNNSFAPDLVLTWPREGTERFVYLRTSANIGFLIQDVALIDDSTSIVMPLSDITSAPAAEASRQELQVASRTKRSLITQPRSFESLGDLRRQQPVASLASRSLLQAATATSSPTRLSDSATPWRGASTPRKRPTLRPQGWWCNKPRISSILSVPVR